VLIRRFPTAGAYLRPCAIMQPGGVGIMRFFKQAERPAGVSRLAAAVAGLSSPPPPCWRVDSVLPHSRELFAADEALITPGPADLAASGKLGNASWEVIFRPSGPIGPEPGLMRYYAFGQAFEFMSIASGPFPRTPLRSDPAWFDSVRGRADAGWARGGRGPTSRRSCLGWMTGSG
jgi:hypothetical protein